MRTTLSIDEDVLLAVKERAHRERRPVGKVLSELARQALTQRDTPPQDHPGAFHGFDPLPHRGAAVSNTLVDRLRDEEVV